jgi:hypothetical protein
MRSIKRNCLAHFSINRLYTWLDVVEIIFYHQTRTSPNGDPIHGACDLGFTSRMLAYAPHVFSQVEGVYMDPIRAKVHREANL